MERPAITTIFAAILVLPVALAGCSSKHDRSIVDGSRTFSVAEKEQRLRQAYNEWKGTSHKYGGTSRRGIDCSAFVQTVFRDKFGVALPRSAAEMSRVGNAIARRQLRTGDLVLFKPGVHSHHVGVYLSGNEFLHVSARKGVTISRADVGYWSKRYWTARRVLR
jgi:lipoprotein Spr